MSRLDKNTCQSCGSMMVKGQLDRRGTNADGSRSDTYCNHCYLNGKFQNPDLTYEQMLEDCMQSIEVTQMSKLNRWILRKTYPSRLKTLKRWR